MGKHKKVIQYKDKESHLIKIVPSTSQAGVTLFTATTFCTILGIYYDLWFQYPSSVDVDNSTALIWCLHVLRDGETAPVLRITAGIQDQDDDILLYKAGRIFQNVTTGMGLQAIRWKGKVGAMRQLKNKDSFRIQTILDLGSLSQTLLGTITLIIGQK